MLAAAVKIYFVNFLLALLNFMLYSAMLRQRERVLSHMLCSILCQYVNVKQEGRGAARQRERERQWMSFILLRCCCCCAFLLRKNRRGQKESSEVCGCFCCFLLILLLIRLVSRTRIICIVLYFVGLFCVFSPTLFLYPSKLKGLNEFNHSYKRYQIKQCRLRVLLWKTTQRSILSLSLFLRRHSFA